MAVKLQRENLREESERLKNEALILNALVRDDVYTLFKMQGEEIVPGIHFFAVDDHACSNHVGEPLGIEFFEDVRVEKTEREDGSKDPLRPKAPQIQNDYFQLFRKKSAGAARGAGH